MPRVAVLPPAVADQIAAGEVVERPASVVKELVENALDAGATTIAVAVEDGGRQRIRISDDGSGMERDDAVLALARHATSKIRHAADLVGIASFGFRGEALPSICSVSELTIETAPADGAGTRVRAVAGTIADVGEVARRRGTTVEVARLFHNAPARQKFLRGARSEWRAIADALVVTALTRRDIRLTATHDGKPSITLAPAASLRERVSALWGAGFAERFIEVDDVRGPIHVCGLAERPADAGSSGRRTFLTVQGRPVRDTGIIRAAELAYRSAIPAGVRPSLLLEIVLPGSDVDVNVHPAKAEVRFHDRWMVERAVEAAVRRALGTMDSAPAFGFRAPRAADPFHPPAPSVDVEALHPAARDEPLFASGDASAALASVPSVTASPTPAADAPADDAPAAAPIPPLLQLRRTFIMFESDDGVVLIDQHSAHERILFERFMRMLEEGHAPSQQLLFPLTLHLGPAEADAFEANHELLGRLGYDAESFGGHTVLVRAVPAPHPRFDAERCLRDTLASLSGDREAGVAARHVRLAATVACKAAVKAGDALAPSEMQALFVALRDTALPAHDVHGRSTIVRLSWDELERRFGRR
ncbi:MAG TPA: DNA mismatch repair endonuclease MutL [Gemmatimonadaceae bacterium]|nr:DNA mismatch repair endonuclease MutL [Gemmatimonadaceae bacterium]